jgi:hypothetical protein
MSFLKRFKDLIRFNEPERVVPTTTATRPTETTTDLTGLKLVELRTVAKDRGLKGYTKLKKADLLALLSE